MANLVRAGRIIVTTMTLCCALIQVSAVPAITRVPDTTVTSEASPGIDTLVLTSIGVRAFVDIKTLTSVPSQAG